MLPVFGVRPAGVSRSFLAPPLGLLGVLLVILGTAAPASATWSIVAVDPETGRVGAVMASCVPAGVLGNSDETLVPIVLVPGQAAAVAQGTINPESPVGLRQLLTDGATPRETIDALLEIDDQPTARQFGIATIDPTASAVAYTGENVELERGDRTLTPTESQAAEGNSVAISVQGVLLADQAVLDRSLSAVSEALGDGEPLEEALVAGLVAGSEAGGDRRCGEQTALFAHLVVAEPDDDPSRPSVLLTVTVDEGDGQNPVPELATALAAGESGWVDIGLNDPLGIPRTAVFAVGTLLAIAAFFTIRKGMGSPAARR